MFEWEVSQTAKNQHSELNGNGRNQRIMGLFIFFLTTRVAWSFVEKKGCSIWKLVVASTQDWYKILETMTLWHSYTKYRYKILSDHTLECFMYGISKYSRWALLIDDVPWIFFMVTCLKSATWRCHLGVKRQQVSNVWFIGRRLQVWSIEKVWSWQSFAA